jgi:hypothetical protein
MTNSTYYASVIKQKATDGNARLLKNENITKLKFYIYTGTNISTNKRDTLAKRIRDSGGEVTYSVNKGIDYLVVTDQIFKFSNKKLLEEAAIFTEAGSEDTSTQIHQMFNDRSLRLLSSSPSLVKDTSSKVEDVKLTPCKQKQENAEYDNLFGFFNCKNWNLISVTDLVYKLDLLESDHIDWHINWGFNPSPIKTAAHLVLTELKKPRGKERKMHAHTFQFNPKIVKCDVSRLNLEAPEGTSVFQTQHEYDMAVENFAKLMNKHENNIHRLKQLPLWHSEIDEQMPIPATIMWSVWKFRVYNYFEHVRSTNHKKWLDKHAEDYKTIDGIFEVLNKESRRNIKKPPTKKKTKVDLITQKIAAGKRMIKRKIKEQAKEEMRMIHYIHDRLVVMQIETQSQPFNRQMNQSSSMMEQSQTKNSNWQKWYSPQSNSIDFVESWVRPFPYIKQSIRRHVAKRPKKIFDYDIHPKKTKKIRRNKRLRQTYFATNFNTTCQALNLDDEAKPETKLKDTTIDMYFRKLESVDLEMHVENDYE